MVFDAKLAILLEHLVKLDVFLLDAVQIIHHATLVVHQFQKVVERIAIVGHSPSKHNLEVEPRDGFAVQVDIACDGFLVAPQTLTSSAYCRAWP